MVTGRVERERERERGGGRQTATAR